MRGLAIAGVVIVCLHYCSGVSQAGSVEMAKAAATRKSAAKANPEEIRKAFEAFCADWMQKLAARERENVAKIVWNNDSDGVEGEYVGYTNDHTCMVKDGGSAPVGQITYLEVRYAKRGRTIEDAQRSVGEPVERTGVTELFGYSKGKWVY